MPGREIQVRVLCSAFDVRQERAHLMAVKPPCPRAQLALCPGCPKLPVPISAPDPPEDFSFCFLQLQVLKSKDFLPGICGNSGVTQGQQKFWHGILFVKNIL